MWYSDLASPYISHILYIKKLASFPVATYGLGHRSLKVLWLALLDLLILMFKTLWISSCLLIDASYDILYMPWFGPWKLLAPRSLPILIKYWFETKYPMRIHEIKKSLIRSKTLPRNNKKKSFLNLNRIIRKVVAIGLLYLFTSLIRKPDLDSLFFQILNRLLIMKMRLKGYKTRI